MTDWFSGRAVLVTGATRGIGAATARELAARGARVALVGRDRELLASVAEELGPRHAWFVADVTDEASLAAAVKGAVGLFGGLDGLVCNAGIVAFGSVSTVPVDEFARVVDTNLNGVYRTVRAALPHLIARRGRIMIVSSMTAFASIGGLGAYAASKAGGEALAQVLRFELADAGVSVGTFHPNWVGTDMLRDSERDMPSFAAYRARLPFGLGATLTPEACAVSIVNGMGRRARRVFLPRHVVALAAFRPVVTSRLGEAVSRRLFAETVRRFDREAAAGRS